MEISASENVVANTDKKKYTKLSKKHTCGICFRAESLECLSGGIAMIEATSCGGVVIFRGKILVLYKNYRNKYEGWVLPKGTVEAGEEFKETALREVTRSWLLNVDANPFKMLEMAFGNPSANTRPRCRTLSLAGFGLNVRIIS